MKAKLVFHPKTHKDRDLTPVVWLYAENPEESYILKMMCKEGNLGDGIMPVLYEQNNKLTGVSDGTM